MRYGGTRPAAELIPLSFATRYTMTKKIFTLTLSCLLFAPAFAQTPPSKSDPFVVERTLWVQPRRMVQFMTLFDRVERPRLEALRKDGRVLWYRISQPLMSAENDAWDLRVTIAWRDPETAADKFDARAVKGRVDTEGALLEELIVDQRETWVRETLRSTAE